MTSVQHTSPLQARWLCTSHYRLSPQSCQFPPMMCCLSCCSPSAGNAGFPNWKLILTPTQPLTGSGAIQEASGSSGLTGEGDGCKQKSFGSLLEDTGQLKLNHQPKEVPAWGAQISAAIPVTAKAVLPVPAWLLEKHCCSLPVPRVTPASMQCFPLVSYSHVEIPRHRVGWNLRKIMK